MTHSQGRRRLKRWSPEEVVRELRAESDLSAKHVQKTNSSLYGAALRHFKSWRAAVEAAGFDYHLVARRQIPGYWTKELIIGKIKELSPKNSNYARKHHASLYNAALRRFKSWKAAVEASGIDYDTVKKGWVSEDGEIRFQKR
jgi:hypothetical protein